MDDKVFPWTGPFEAPIKKPPQIAEEIKPEHRAWDFLKSHFAYLIMALLFVMVFFFRTSKKPAAPELPPSVDALVVMLATPKGTFVVPETLRQIPLNPRSLTKTQAFQLVQAEDLVKLKGRVRAKKDLPPNKPLFWTDLEFSQISPIRLPTQIIFSKE